MASTFVTGGGKDLNPQNHHQMQSQISFKKAWPANPQPSTPTSPQGHHHHQTGGVPRKCVCAPSTHSGSFKCRLHRVNSNGHSAPTPAPPPPAGPASSTRTVEAQ